MMKWIKRFIFLLFAGFLILGAILQLKGVRESAKSYLIEKIESETGYNVQIDDLRLFPSFQLTARDVILLDGSSPIIAFDHIHLGIYPLDLISGKMHFSTLHIEGVNILNPPKGEFSGQQSENGAPNIVIDDLFIEEINWLVPGVKSPDYPVTFRGNFIARKDNLYSNFKISSPKSPSQWISGDFNFEENQGALIVQKNHVGKASLEFSIEDNNRVIVPRFFAKWETFSIDGKFTVNKNGDIEQSIFFLVVDDLSNTTPLSGALFGEAVVSGNILLPKLDLYLISDSITGYDQKIENFKLRLSTVDKGVFALSFIKSEQPYHFSSTLSWDQNTPWFPTRLDLRLPLEEIAQLVNWDVADIDGQILIHTRFQDGTLKFRGELLDGVVESFDIGSRFTKINGVIEGDLDALRLSKFSARDTDGGKYHGEGELLLNPEKDFPFSFTFDFEKARPFQSDILKSTMNGQLTFSGTSSKATLAGDLEALSPRIRIPEKLPESTGSISVTYINQPENETPPTQPSHFTFEWPVELDINYTVSDQLKIKGRGLNSFWTGGINIGGTLVNVKTKGELKLVQGDFLFRGKKFEFNQGAITFNGEPAKNTSLFLTAELDLEELTVHCALKGPIFNPSITLTSSPPMSQRAILSWLLFGKGVSEINPMEETQLSRSLRSLLDKVDDKPDLLTRVGDIFGLDQVEIGTTPSGSAGDLTVRVGKYITEGTYFTISRNISRGKDTDKDTSCFGIETKVGRHFRVRAEGDTETNGRLNLLWKNEY